jgi:broad specificity phosphatase PhoE
MSEIYLVRHGQARLFTEDYDRLSDLGVGQAEALGHSWIEQGIRPKHVWSGTLKRQIRTARSVGEIFTRNGEHWPESSVSEQLNEYPAEEILRSLGRQLRETEPKIQALADAFEAAVDPDDRYRHFHRLLVAVTACWVSGDYQCAGVPISWAEWSGSVRNALRRIMQATDRGESVAVFTSGGPIGVSMQTILGAPDIKAAELNWRIHNGSVTRFTFSGERVSLDRFNDVAHLKSENLTYR